jgi:hypothetical protein
MVGLEARQQPPSASDYQPLSVCMSVITYCARGDLQGSTNGALIGNIILDHHRHRRYRQTATGSTGTPSLSSTRGRNIRFTAASVMMACGWQAGREAHRAAQDGSGRKCLGLTQCGSRECLRSMAGRPAREHTGQPRPGTSGKTSEQPGRAAGNASHRRTTTVAWLGSPGRAPQAGHIMERLSPPRWAC